MLIIRNGTLVTDTDTFQADILVDGERIIQVGAHLPIPEGAQVIDATDRLVLPGGVDVHTHFDLEMAGTVTADDHYSGHKAAAFGGTTSVIDFIPHGPGALREEVAGWHARVENKAAVDYGFHMNISRLDDHIAGQIPGLVTEGITSLKVFMAYPNLQIADGQIFQVMRIAARHGMLTMLHAEGGDVIEILRAEALKAGHTSPVWHARTRPAWGAVEATLRGIALAAVAEAPLYLVHLNAAGEVDMLEYGRQQGVKVMGETCPQYLFFTQQELERPDGAKWVCSPPIRGEGDNQRLWEGLARGSIRVIGTDHCSFFYDGTRPIQYEGQPFAVPGKELGRTDFSKIPNGLPGVGDRLPVLWTKGVVEGRISPNQFVAVTATNPARIFGLYPRKGALLPGSDADFVLWDAGRQLTYGVEVAQHRTDYNLYEGWSLLGYPDQVFLRGQKIVDGPRWLGRAGMGRYLHRRANGDVL